MTGWGHSQAKAQFVGGGVIRALLLLSRVTNRCSFPYLRHRASRRRFRPSIVTPSRRS